MFKNIKKLKKGMTNMRKIDKGTMNEFDQWKKLNLLEKRTEIKENKKKQRE